MKNHKIMLLTSLVTLLLVMGFANGDAFKEGIDATLTCSIVTPADAHYTELVNW